MRAPFFVFEGGDGAGKTTQIDRLRTHLEGRGLAVEITREPGGTPAAEEIRSLMVTGDPDRFDAHTEMLLAYAARAEHLARRINPARASGAIVISDRFSDSTRAYQGYAGGVDLQTINALDKIVVGADGPDLTFILDLPVAAGLNRAMRGGNRETRFEEKGLEFQEKVRAGFLDIARNAPDNHVIVDASTERDTVAEKIAAACDPHVMRWLEAIKK